MGFFSERRKAIGILDRICTAVDSWNGSSSIGRSREKIGESECDGVCIISSQLSYWWGVGGQQKGESVSSRSLVNINPETMPLLI